MSTFWSWNGKLLHSMGKIIACDQCPCLCQFIFTECCPCEFSDLYINIDDSMRIELISSDVTNNEVRHLIRIICIADNESIELNLTALKCDEIDCDTLNLPSLAVGQCFVGTLQFGNDVSCLPAP